MMVTTFECLLAHTLDLRARNWFYMLPKMIIKMDSRIADEAFQLDGGFCSFSSRPAAAEIKVLALWHLDSLSVKQE